MTDDRTCAFPGEQEHDHEMCNDAVIDAGRRYPIPAADDDDRFTFGLILDVADVLASHGYPKLTSGDDYVELQGAVFRFIYDTTTIPAEPAPGLDPTTEEC
jgi:hypothetical protein